MDLDKKEKEKQQHRPISVAGIYEGVHFDADELKLWLSSGWCTTFQWYIEFDIGSGLTDIRETARPFVLVVILT